MHAQTHTHTHTVHPLAFSFFFFFCLEHSELFDRVERCLACACFLTCAVLLCSAPYSRSAGAAFFFFFFAGLNFVLIVSCYVYRKERPKSFFFFIIIFLLHCPLRGNTKLLVASPTSVSTFPLAPFFSFFLLDVNVFFFFSFPPPLLYSTFGLNSTS